jgi:hypothetical protein
MHHPPTRSSRPSPFLRSITLVASALAVGTACGQFSSWTNPSGGFFDEASNWSNGVPYEAAMIDLPGAYTVTVRQSGFVDLLSITNPDAELRIPSPQEFFVRSGILRNDGLVVVQADDGLVVGRPGVPARVSGTGTVRLLQSANGGTIEFGGEGVHEAGHTITGRGRIYGAFTHHGTIVADDEVLRVIAEVVQGPTGVMRAVNRGFLYIESRGNRDASVRNGRLEADATSSITLAGGRLDNVELVGTTRMLSGTSVGASGLINNGEINFTIAIGTLNLGFVDGATLGGNGRVIFGPSMTSSAQLGAVTSPLGTPATHGLNHTIMGSGTIRGSWVNHGLIISDRNGGRMDIEGEFTQSATGELRAVNGASVWAEVDIMTGGTISTDTGGSIYVYSDLPLFVPPGRIAEVHSTADLRVPRGLRMGLGAPGFTNDGTLTLNEIAWPQRTELLAVEPAAIVGTGSIVLGMNPADTDFDYARLASDAGVTLTLGPGQTVTGRGRLAGSIRLEGVLSPGSAASPIEVIRVDANGPDSRLVLAETAALRAQANFVFSHDRIEATAPVELGGTLRFETIDGFVPFLPTEFPLITAPSITGGFDAIEFTGDLPPGGVFRVFVEPTRVLAVVTCSADLALPVGSLTFADISAFLAAFAARDPAADFAAPAGEFTFADISAFLSAFAGGCP